MDEFSRAWIIETGVPIVRSYGGNITLRALHYRLVAKGMTNTIQHYKRVIGAMKAARWDGILNFDDFVDHDREKLGETKSKVVDLDDSINEAKVQIGIWMTAYYRNRWENQPIYPEVWIEKKALISVFEQPCKRKRVALCPCKGYPSLTFLYDAYTRFRVAYNYDKELVILYYGDYDPSGEDIPRNIRDTLAEMGVDVDVRRQALMESQVVEWGLPPAPVKIGDSRTRNWTGIGQVELDAVEPNQLTDMVNNAIDEVFDEVLHDDLMEIQEEETIEYRSQLKTFVQEIGDEEDEDDE